MTSIPAGEAAPPEAPEKRMPSGIWYIVSNEFAERFSFYGINAILTTYFAQHLHFTEAKAASWQSLFKAGAYFFPILGAIVADVFWGKYRTIITFSILYAIGCIALATVGDTAAALAGSLLLVALGTGGIKPCVSTNVGDQFTAKNQHLIERAFSWFYMAINLGSVASFLLCPWFLEHPAYGPRWAFGVPAAMMLAATVVFWAGRRKFAVVPPAGRAWLDEILSKDGLKLVLNLAVIYIFVGFFWMLWDQANGNTWTLQARSVLMDKRLAFGVEFLPAQLGVVNALFILTLAPFFSYVVYPFWGRFVRVTPLRKIGLGLFTACGSFLIIARVEQRLMAGEVVSVWWQILAYLVLTCSEILVSITALEFSYKQAPLRMKSFVMALFYMSISLGNVMFATVNGFMVKPVHATAVETGQETWVTVDEAEHFVVGQKVDFTGDHGVQLVSADGSQAPLEGTFLVKAIAGGRLQLMDAVDRRPVASHGTFRPTGQLSTSRLVGPDYFYFFIGIVLLAGVLFVFVAMAYRERSYVRDEGGAAATATTSS